MKISRLIIFLIMGLFGCLIVSTITQAQDFFRGKGGRPDMEIIDTVGMPGLQGLFSFLKLNLSQEQQKVLLDIFDEYHEMRMAYMNTIIESDHDMFDFVTAEKLDEGNARAVFKRQEAVREEIMILDLKMMNKIKKVLTSEQLEIFKGPVPGNESPFPPH